MQYCKSRFGYRVAYPVSVFFLYIIQVPKCNNRKREIPRGEKMMKGMKLVPEEREKEIHIYDGASINIKNKKKKKGKRFFILFFPVVQRIGRGSPKGTATTTTRTLRVSSFSQSIFFLAFRSCLKIWKRETRWFDRRAPRPIYGEDWLCDLFPSFCFPPPVEYFKNSHLPAVSFKGDTALLSYPMPSNWTRSSVYRSRA